jgi:POT family proton-dependent oligopeptide transporter
LAPLICGTLGELYGWHYGFGAAGVGMVAGLLIYLAGQKHLPPEQPRQAAANDDARKGFDRRTILVLLGIGLSVTVFRAAYEQVGVRSRCGQTAAFPAAGASGPMTWFHR